MVLETRFAGTDLVGFLTITRDGDQAQAAEFGKLAKCADRRRSRSFRAVQCRVGSTSGRNERAREIPLLPSWAIFTSKPQVESSMAIPSPHPGCPQRRGSASGASAAWARNGSGSGCAGFSGSRDSGNHNVNSLPSPAPALVGRDTAAVHFGKRLDQGQTDSQTSLGPIKRLIDLSKRFEYLSQHFWRNADPVVANSDNCPVAITVGR